MDYQYYPTGEKTAALMWAKFKRPIRHVCDPSAGKGHLIRHAKEGFPGLDESDIPWLADVQDVDVPNGRFGATRLREYARQKFADLPEVSAIEIDVAHHSSLKELGVKVLGYDFLETSSLATVSHLILNPPFAEGCAHVLHGWDCLHDGEVVAIVNAQTLRNPYTQERRRLVELIERHGSFEYLTDQFVDDVARKTSVEIALIYLEKVPQKYLDVNALLGDLRRGDNEHRELDPEISSALALPGNFISDTYARFELAVGAARNASEQGAIAATTEAALGLTLAEMQAKGVGSEFREMVGSVRSAANEDFKRRYDVLKKKAWSQIIRSSLLNDKLSNQARRKVEASAQDIYELEFTVANVHGFLAGVMQSLGDVYQQMLVDMFDSIIGRSSDNVVFYRSYKSNEKHRIGMRLRRSRFILPRFRMGFGGSLDYEDERFLADIDRCWGVLNGINGHYDGLVEAVKKNDLRSSDRYQSRFFSFRYYKGTQTIHFYPNDSEVMEKMNRFVGKLRRWLPGDMEEANADFAEQYNSGETLTKEYLQEYSRGSLRSIDRPHYKLLRRVQGCSDDGDFELDRLDLAIERVHESKGLQCGPALTSEPSSGAGMVCDERGHKPPPSQMLLLAA